MTKPNAIEGIIAAEISGFLRSIQAPDAVWAEAEIAERICAALDAAGYEIRKKPKT